MDFPAFKAQLEAARRLEHTVGAMTFSVTLPTEYQSRVVFEENRDALGRVEFTKAFRALGSRTVTGWRGVTQRDFSADAPADAVPFSAEAREFLLDIRQDVCDELGTFVSARMKERRDKLEAAAKN